MAAAAARAALMLLAAAAAARGGVLRAAPPVADFSLQAACAASRRLLVLTHDGAEPGDAPLRIASVTTSPSRDFHALSVPPTALAPGDALRINVVAIPRTLGDLRGNLTVRFEGGAPPDATFPLTAIGIVNPYRVSAVDAVVPVGRQYSHVISVFNPATQPHRLERLRDAFVLDAPHLQLEVPTGYVNVTSAPGGRPPHTWELVATGWAPLPPGAPPRAPPAPLPPTWAIPPGASAQVVRVTIRPTLQAGAVADAHVHVQLSFGELIIPMSFTSVLEGVAPHPGTLDMGLVINSHGMVLHSPLHGDGSGSGGGSGGGDAATSTATAAALPPYVGYQAARMANRPPSFWGGAPPVARAWCVNATGVGARAPRRGGGAAAAAAAATAAAAADAPFAASWAYMHCLGSELAPGAPSPAATSAAFRRDPALRLPGGGLQRSFPALWHLYGSAPGWLAAAHTPGRNHTGSSGGSGSAAADAAPLLVPVEVAAKAQRTACRLAPAAAAAANGSDVRGGNGGGRAVGRFRWATCGHDALPPNALAVPNFPDGSGPIGSEGGGGGWETSPLTAGGADSSGHGVGGGGQRMLVGMAHGHAVRDAGLYSAAYAATIAVHAGQLRARGGGGSGGSGETSFESADRPLTPQHGPYRSVSLANVGRGAPVVLTHAYAAVTGSHWRGMNGLQQRVAGALAWQVQREAAAAAAATTAAAAAAAAAASARKPAARHRASSVKAGGRHKHKTGKGAAGATAASAAAAAAVAAALPSTAPQPAATVWADTLRAAKRNATAAVASGFLRPLVREWFTLSERRRASVSLPAGMVLHGDLYLRELRAGQTATVAAALHTQLFAPLFHQSDELYGPVHASSAAADAELGSGLRVPTLLNGSLLVRASGWGAAGADSSSISLSALSRLEVPMSVGVLHGGFAYALEDTLFSPLDAAAHDPGVPGSSSSSRATVTTTTCVPLAEFALNLRSRLLTTLPPVTLAALTSATEGGGGGGGGALLPPARLRAPGPAADAALRAALLPLASSVAAAHAAVARCVLADAVVVEEAAAAAAAQAAAAATSPGGGSAPPPLSPCIPSDVRAITLHSGFARATMASPIFVAHPALHILRPDVESVPPKGGRLTVTVARHTASWRRGGPAAAATSAAAGAPSGGDGSGASTTTPAPRPHGGSDHQRPSPVRAVLAALAALADVLRDVHSPHTASDRGGGDGASEPPFDDDVRRAAGSLAAIAHDVLALSAAYLVRFGAAGGLSAGGGGGRNVMLRPAREFVGSFASSALATTPLVRVWQFSDGSGGGLFNALPYQPLRPWSAPASAAGAGECAGGSATNKTLTAPLPSRRLGAYLRDAATRRLRHDQPVVTVASIAHGLHGDCTLLARGDTSLLGEGHASTAGFAGELLGCAALAFEPAPAAANEPWLRAWRRVIGGAAGPLPRAAASAGSSDVGSEDDDGAMAALAAALRRIFTDASAALRTLAGAPSGEVEAGEATEMRDRVLDALGASVMDVVDSLAIHALAATAAGDGGTAAVGFTAPLTLLTDVGAFGVPLIIPATSTPSLAAQLQPLPWVASPGVPDSLSQLSPPAAALEAGVAGAVDGAADLGSWTAAQRHLLHRLAVLHGFQLQEGREFVPVALVSSAATPPPRDAVVVQLDVTLFSADQSTVVIDVVNREAVPVFLTDLAGGGESNDDPAHTVSVWVAVPVAGGRPQPQPPRAVRTAETLVVPPTSALTLVVELPPPGSSFAAALNASGLLRFAARRTRQLNGPVGWFSVNLVRAAAAGSPSLRVEAASCAAPRASAGSEPLAAPRASRAPASHMQLPAHVATWASLLRVGSGTPPPPTSASPAISSMMVELEPIMLGGTRSGRLVLHNPASAPPLTVAAVGLSAPPLLLDGGLVNLLPPPAAVFPLVIPPNSSATLGTLRFSLSALCKARGGSARAVAVAVVPGGTVRESEREQDASSCFARTARYLGFELPPRDAAGDSDGGGTVSYWRRVAASGVAWLTAAVLVELAAPTTAVGGVHMLPPLAVMVPLRPQSLLDLPPPPAGLGAATGGHHAAGVAATATDFTEWVVVKLPPVEGAVHTSLDEGSGAMRVRVRAALPPQWLYVPVVNHAAVAVHVALRFPSECSRVGGEFEEHDAPGAAHRYYTAAPNVSSSHGSPLPSSHGPATTPPVWYVPATILLRGSGAAAGASRAAPARNGPCAAFSTSLQDDATLLPTASVVLSPRGGRALLGPVVFAPELSAAAAEALGALTAGFQLQLQLVNNLTGSETVSVRAYLSLPSLRVGLAAAVGSGGAQPDWLHPPLASSLSPGGDAPPTLDVHTWLHRAVNASVAVTAPGTAAGAAACQLPDALAGACHGEGDADPTLELRSHFTLVTWLSAADATVSVYRDTPGGQLSDALRCRLASSGGCRGGHHPPPTVPAVTTSHGVSVGPALFEHRPVVMISATLSVGQARASCAMMRVHPAHTTTPGWHSGWQQLRQLLASPSSHAAWLLRALEGVLVGGAPHIGAVPPPSVMVNQTLLLSGAPPHDSTLPVRVTLAPQHSELVLEQLLLQAGVCEAVPLSQVTAGATTWITPPAPSPLHQSLVVVAALALLAAVLGFSSTCKTGARQAAVGGRGVNASAPVVSLGGRGVRSVVDAYAPDGRDHDTRAVITHAPAAASSSEAVAHRRSVRRGGEVPLLGVAPTASPMLALLPIQPDGAPAAMAEAPPTRPPAQSPAEASRLSPSREQQQQQQQQQQQPLPARVAAGEPSAEAALDFLQAHPDMSYADALTHTRGVTLAYLQAHPDMSYTAALQALAQLHSAAGSGGRATAADGDTSLLLQLPASVVTITDSAAATSGGGGGLRRLKRPQPQHAPGPRSPPPPGGGHSAAASPRIPQSPLTVSLLDARRSLSAHSSSVSLSTMNVTVSHRASNASDIVSDDAWELAPTVAAKPRGLPATAPHSSSAVAAPLPRAPGSGGGHDGRRQSPAAATASLRAPSSSRSPATPPLAVRLRRPDMPSGAPLAAGVDLHHSGRDASPGAATQGAVTGVVTHAATQGAVTPPPRAPSYVRAVDSAASRQPPSQHRATPPPLPPPQSAPGSSTSSAAAATASRGTLPAPVAAVSSSPLAPASPSPLAPASVTRGGFAVPSSSSAATVPTDAAAMLQVVRAQLLRSAAVGDTGGSGSGSGLAHPPHWDGGADHHHHHYHHEDDDDALDGGLGGSLSASAPSFTPASAVTSPFSPPATAAAAAAAAPGSGGYAPLGVGIHASRHPLASLWGSAGGGGGGGGSGGGGGEPAPPCGAVGGASNGGDGAPFHDVPRAAAYYHHLGGGLVSTSLPPSPFSATLGTATPLLRPGSPPPAAAAVHHPRRALLLEGMGGAASGANNSSSSSSRLSSRLSSRYSSLADLSVGGGGGGGGGGTEPLHHHHHSTATTAHGDGDDDDGAGAFGGGDAGDAGGDILLPGGGDGGGGDGGEGGPGGQWPTTPQHPPQQLLLQRLPRVPSAERAAGMARAPSRSALSQLLSSGLTE